MGTARAAMTRVRRPIVPGGAATRRDRACTSACARRGAGADRRGRGGDPRRRLAAGGKLLVFGNGGSAADAQHFAAELVGRFERERAGAAGAGADDRHQRPDRRRRTTIGSSGFSRGRSRRSAGPATWRSGFRRAASRRTCWRRCEAASARGLKTIALTGTRRRRVGAAAAIHINVPDESTARVQEVHMTVIHVICELVERRVSRVASRISIALKRSDALPELRSETMTVNMGPQHPSTHGVLRIVLELSGETVVGADTTIGYLHTGIEKTAEQKKWQQVIPLVERMDYLGAQSNSLAFCLSVERLLGVESARARAATSAC